MKIKISTYYDVTCDNCARSWSTDFNMGMNTSKAALSRLAYQAGWKCKGGQTLCPDCAKASKA